MQKIHSFIKGLDFKTSQKDEKTQDTVIRNFEIIGEAANQVPNEIKEQYTEIP